VPTEWVEFHYEAGIEFDTAFEWYIERSADAAVRFDAEVDHALTQMIAAPKRWAVGTHGTRRFLLQRFPYILIYRELASSGQIQILAVAHTSRRPSIGRSGCSSLTIKIRPDNASIMRARAPAPHVRLQYLLAEG
jgi:toxin ParE1/3/4